jgi:hypothetical protein
MKKAFLLGFFVVLFLSIISLAVYKWVTTGIELSNRPSPIKSNTTSPSDILTMPKLGLKGIHEAKAAILKVVDLGIAVVPELKKLLKGGNDYEKVDALDALKWISFSEAVSEARGLLSDTSVQVRIRALEIISRGGTAEDAKRTEELLTSGDPLERTAALTTMTFILREKAIPTILEATKDSAALVRARASEALEALTWQNFGLKHSGYPSDEAEARAKITSFIEQNGLKTRYEWLTMRVETELDGLHSEDFFTRYDATNFFDKLQMNAGFDPWLKPQDSAEKADEIRTRWEQTKKLFEADVPLLLYRESE